MNLVNKLFSLDKAPILSDVLSLYLSVKPDQIMNCLTEFETNTVEIWADDNFIDISDMLDIIQNNLKSVVTFSTKTYCSTGQLLVNSLIQIIDNCRTYRLSLIWCLDD